MYGISGENDFKYYMQDIERHYFGCRGSYRYLLDNESVPFKFKSVITKYLKDSVDFDTTLESHLYYMEKDSFDYEVYKQLKARVRVVLYKNPSKKEKGFKEKLLTIEQLVRIPADEKEALGMIVRELVLSKLALFAFSI
ncbi:MAG: hypothetical protein E7307_10860 [Butyrivibrio sp.]|nr:hypothetical protein [Butyrivibrio sp.]